MPSGPAQRRQPLLIATPSPLSERLGREFFRKLPAGPGVYFFRDAAGALLYIGQSRSLRHRIGSYRHIDQDRHSRRLLRLIHRVASIEWRECGTPAEAIALEAALLLEHRPPFNRAGVWPRAVWWLEVRLAPDNHLRLRLCRTPAPVPESGEQQEPDDAPQPGFLPEFRSAEDSETGSLIQWHGPLTSRQRHAFSSLVRCLFLAMHPQCGVDAIPAGLMQNSGKLTHSWILPPEGSAILGQFTDFLLRPGASFPESLKISLEACPAVIANQALRGFWEAQLEEITALLPKS